MTSQVLQDTMRQSWRRGTVGAWPLADASAVDLRSVMAPAGPLDLTNSNVVTRAVGPGNNLRNACQFVAASTQLLTRADSLIVRPKYNAFYVGCWAYLDTKPVASMYPLSKTTAAAPDLGWYLQWNGSVADRFAFISSPDGTNFGTSAQANVFGPPALATWYWVEGWWDGARQNVSVNLSVEVPTALSAMFPSTGLLRIGGTGDAGLYWDGRLAQPVIMNRVPSLAERRWMYNNGQGRDLRSGV